MIRDRYIAVSVLNSFTLGKDWGNLSLASGAMPTCGKNGLLRALVASLLWMVAMIAVADVQHGGFTVSERRLQAAGHAELSPEISRAIVDQLKIVEAASVPPDVLAFFQSVDISFDPDLADHPGIFRELADKGEVRLRPMSFDRSRPVVLHELLHAFHFYKLGLDHPSIIGAFRKARLDTAGAERIYFLSNPKEFFAVTASIYLVGDIKQPPFSCKALKDMAYMAFLRSQLGPGMCGR